MTANRKFLALATGAVLLAGGISVAAFAGPGHGGHKIFKHRGGMGLPGMHLLRLADRLELTEEQDIAALRMRRAIRAEAKQNRQQMKAAFDQVLVELEKPQPDAARLHRLVDEASARMTKLAHSSVDQYLQFHGTLTDQQRKTLVEDARAMKARREQFKKQRIQK